MSLPPLHMICVDFRDILRKHFNEVMASDDWRETLSDTRMRLILRNFFHDNEKLPIYERRRLYYSPNLCREDWEFDQPPEKKRKMGQEDSSGDGDGDDDSSSTGTSTT